MTVSPSLRTLQLEAALGLARLNAKVWHDLYLLHWRSGACCQADKLCPFGQELNDAADAEGRRVQALEGYL